MKTFITIVLTLVAGTGAVWLFGKLSGRGPGGQPPVVPDTPVRIEPAVLGDLIEVVSAPGVVQPKTKVSISARISARIEEIKEEGVEVTRGNPAATPPVQSSVLVRLDSKDLEAALKSAKARKAAQQAQLRVTQARLEAQSATIAAARVTQADYERDLKRQQDLLASKDVGQSVVDEAQTKVDGQRAQLRAAEATFKAEEANIDAMRSTLDAAAADIDKAEEELKYTLIQSTIDGIVTKVNAEKGEMVVTGTMNNAGTVIMEVADLSAMQVQAKVDESTVAGVAAGQHAVAHVGAYGDETFPGTVYSVALQNTEDKDLTRYFKVVIDLHLAKGRRILSGLTADVDVETKRHQGVIKVPSQSVLGRSADDLPEDVRQKPEVDRSKSLATVVYRFVDGKAVATPVTVGPSDATHTLIRSGLQAGDKVITGPYKALESLANGQKVKDNRTPATTQAATNPS